LHERIGAFLKFGTPVTALGVVWSPGEVQYTIDGNVWATESNPNVSTAPMNIVLQSRTACESAPGLTCTVPWAAHEPNVDVDWVVAYGRK
jgi:beta-glucanase (GH16 family)